jgi:hypothetical protein
MQRFTILTLLSLVSLFLSPAIYAQEANSESTEYRCDDICEFTLKNGTVYIGSLVEINEDVLVVLLEDGLRLEIPKSQLKQIKNVPKSRIKGNKYWQPMPVENSYFFGSSARNIDKKDLVYRNSYIFLNGVDYGLTDWLSIGGGLEILSTFSTDTPPIGYLRLKAGIPLSDKISVGANLFHIGIPDEEAISFSTLSFTYGVAENHFTLGLGFAVEDEASGAIITASYLRRISRRTAFISENYFLSEDVGANLFSYGVRFFGDKLSVDFGFFNNETIGDGILIGIPYLGFQKKF